jgi:nucleotide-binding universal stress UspA family protein
VSTAPERIIVPVTLSPDGDAVVGFAASLAAALGAELVLAGVAPLAPPAGSFPGTPDVVVLSNAVEEQRLLDRLVRERLDELADGLPAGIAARSVLTWGPVGEALVAAAREQHADLVVVSMRHESALEHLIHDHADRYVLHHSDVPVLVVPEPAPWAGD